MLHTVTARAYESLAAVLWMTSHSSKSRVQNRPTDYMLCPALLLRNQSAPLLEEEEGYTDLKRTCHSQVEEERNEEQAGDDTRQTVANSSHEELSSSCVHLGRNAQYHDTAHERHENGQRHRNRRELSIRQQVFLGGALSAACEGMVEADAQRHQQNNGEDDVVDDMKATWRDHHECSKLFTLHNQLYL